MKSVKPLAKRAQRLTEIARLNDEPALICYQSDGTRLVIGRNGEILPGDTPAGRTTKVLIGIDIDKI